MGRKKKQDDNKLLEAGDIREMLENEEKEKEKQAFLKKHKGLSEEEAEEAFLRMLKERQIKELRRARKREVYKQRLKMSAKAIMLGVLFFIVLLFMLLQVYDNATYGLVEPEYTAYSTMLERVEADEVYAIYTVASDTNTIRYKLIVDVPEECRTGDKASYTLAELGYDNWYATQNSSYETFYELLSKHNVPIIQGVFTTLTARLMAFIGALFSLSIPLLFLVVLLILMAKQTGNPKDKITITRQSDKTFDAIIGHDEIVSDLKLYVGLLKKPAEAQKIGVRPPKGLIFNGPPGTGKTLIAKALAGEAGVPFLYLNASNVIELYVGMGARNIRGLFKEARKLAPCVVFIDEIDAIGKKRGHWGSSSEDTQTINALLQELDGFSELQNVLVIAATNDIGSLDDALLRSGRFDRKFEILPPKDKLTRLELLKLYTQKLLLSDEVSLSEIADQIHGFTGADVAVLCNEAALIALQNNESTIKQPHFLEAIDRMLLKGNRVRNNEDTPAHRKDKELVAYHEAGHAVMCYLNDIVVTRVSIQGTTSGVGGFVIPADNDSVFMTKRGMQKQIQVAYAGRASEDIHCGGEDVTTGASNDIQRATELVKQYLMLFGFDDKVGLLDLKTLLEQNICDNAMLLDVMRKMSKFEYDRAYEALSDKYALVEKVAGVLLERETLTKEEFKALCKEYEQGN